MSVSDDIKAALANAEQEIPITIPRWMVSHVADLCMMTGQRHDRKATKSNAVGTTRSNQALAKDWLALADSMRSQRDAQRDNASTNEVRIDITQDGVYHLVNAPHGVSVVLHDYTAPSDWGEVETDDAGYTYQRVNLTVDGESV